MTFSITAKCEKTGQIGIGISTKVIAVGARCIFAKARVGAIASQSFSNPYLGINGLTYLENGLNATEALEKVLSEDPSTEVRQVSIVDSQGNVAVHTGEKCIEWTGHQIGENFSAAGNMLVGKDTIQEMARAFEENSHLKFSNRLLTALEAGQQAGGDKRGRQSAALLIVEEEDYPLLDLRVDEHEDPVKELRRIYEMAQTDLVPRMKTLPTKVNPGGINDLDHAKEIGLVEE